MNEIEQIKAMLLQLLRNDIAMSDAIINADNIAEFNKVNLRHRANQTGGLVRFLDPDKPLM